MNIKLLKNTMREKYKQLRKEIPFEVKKEYDEKICKEILNLASYNFCKTVLMYAPLKYEVDIMEIAKDAVKNGKKVAFPLCNTDNLTMEFKYVSSENELSKGSYSIMEPIRCCESVADFENSICIVPAIAFDKKGYRIGYGKGYYDKFLSSYKGTKIGVAYSDFIIENIPKGRFDRFVDVLVSEKGVKIANTIS